MSSAFAIDFYRPPRKCIHHAVHNAVKGMTQRQLEQFVFKLEFNVEPDLAGLFLLRIEMPGTTEKFEWPFHQLHVNTPPWLHVIFRTESLFYLAYFHRNCCMQMCFRLVRDLRGPAPGQKIRIGLNIIYQCIHLVCTVRDKCRFMYIDQGK